MYLFARMACQVSENIPAADLGTGSAKDERAATGPAAVGSQR